MVFYQFYFAFDAKAKEVYYVEVFGHRLGSMADPYLIRKVPMSMPIHSLDNQQVIGVMGIAIDLGDFSELDETFNVLLVDLRIDYLDGAQNSGLILHHPDLLDYLVSEREGAQLEKLPRLEDGAVLAQLKTASDRDDGTGTVVELTS